MYNIYPTDFLIFSFDREASQSKVLFQCPRFYTQLPFGMSSIRFFILVQLL